MGKTFNMVGGGTNVVANPALTGTEIDLQGLAVSGTKYKVPLIRPNLLDNWYFVGGGSQQGGGQFPINQRGQTSYTGNVYMFDRWRNDGANASIAVNSDSIHITGPASTPYSFCTQYIENPQWLNGQTITVSVMCKGSNSVRFCLFNMTKTATVGRSTYNSSVDANTYKVYSFTFSLASDAVPSGDKIGLLLYPVNPNTGLKSQTLDVQAIKMELGDTQTLAHNEGTEENPVWVLNEIPNYTEELWKCQRYYQIFASSSYRPTYGEDYRPPMRLHSPSKGTISIGGTTYYYADANL